MPTTKHAQSAVAYLYYKDAGAALDHLTRVFGFTERQRIPRPDGTISHAEVEHGGDVIMLSNPEDGTPGFETDGHDGMYCYVDDVMAHYDMICAAGGKIVFAPLDHGWGRYYGVEDSESRVWYFSERED
jgi:uncharacterized glyoxalase superfamily protein PhnB